MGAHLGCSRIRSCWCRSRAAIRGRENRGLRLVQCLRATAADPATGDARLARRRSGVWNARLEASGGAAGGRRACRRHPAADLTPSQFIDIDAAKLGGVRLPRAGHFARGDSRWHHGRATVMLVAAGAALLEVPVAPRHPWTPKRASCAYGATPAGCVPARCGSATGAPAGGRAQNESSRER
jgi:hypothetical protein